MYRVSVSHNGAMAIPRSSYSLGKHLLRRSPAKSLELCVVSAAAAIHLWGAMFDVLFLAASFCQCFIDRPREDSSLRPKANGLTL